MMAIFIYKFLTGLIITEIFGLSFISCRSGYLLTFPQELQIGAKETFCLSLYNITSDITVNVNISCYDKIIQHQPDTFRKGKHGCFTWRLPDHVTPGPCEITVSGRDDNDEDGYMFTDSKEVQVVDTHQITFIQTDRPIYRPGDIVKFRTLTVTQDLKPLQVNVESITIQDPNGFYMTEWSDVATRLGLVSLEFQLYMEPVLGEWTITAVVNGRKTTQTFVIKEYVLPKFQVNIKMPEKLTVATETLSFKVCAKYTFGKPVKGTMSASVSLRNTQTSWFCEKKIRPCATLVSKLSGCHTFSIETSKLNITDRQYSLLCEPRLVLGVNVTEQNTGAIVHEEEEGTDVSENRVKLTILANKYFKPFFPYTGQIAGTHQDGTPAPAEDIVLTIGKLGIKQMLVTDITGRVNFTITNLTHNMDNFILHVKTTDPEKIDRKRYTIFPATTKLHVKQWYSPTYSYLHVSAGQEQEVPVHCGRSVSLDAVYSKLPDTHVQQMFYQILSKGNIIESKDTTYKLTTARRYVPSARGDNILTPNIPSDASPSLVDKDSTLDINRPMGPPMSSSDAVVGPPGTAHAASPPGSRQVPASGTDTAAPLNKLHVSDSDDGTDLSPEKPSVVTVTPQQPPQLWHTDFSFTVTHEMAPHVRILVYIFMETGEMVADTIDLRVNHCHQNKVKMTFSEKSVQPGEKVTMTMKASPGSLCAATMVDKSVYLHGGINLIQPKHINERQDEFDLTSDFFNDWQYCSDVSDMPPVLSAKGPSVHNGAPGIQEDTDIVPPGPFRKKRSIQQFYSNMYDSLLAFKMAGVMTMTDLDLQTRPCLHSGDNLGPPHIPGDPRGPIPGMGYIDGLQPAPEPHDTRVPKSNLRRYFPETWLWDLHEIPSSGEVSVKETMPDTITEWVGNSVCTNPDSGLGVSEVARVTGFQSFFLSVTSPYSVIRGEIVHIKVTVFNFLPHCIALQVDMVKNGDFVRDDVAEKEPQFCICTSQSKVHTFKIRPQVLGKINITFTAFLREHRVSCNSTIAPFGYARKQSTDLVVKQLVVKAEGIEDERTESHYVCPQDSKDVYEKTLYPDLPLDHLVPGSLKGSINVIGDIMGPVLGGLDNLILLPTGCGEQNMVRLAPNIAILKYLYVTGQLTSDTETKTLDHLHKGYQQQLKFMHKDGSYSAFGAADDAGSTWLSAFVFKTLRQALDYVYVDRKQIQTKTWEFMLAQQGEDGCFTEHGKVLSKYMMGGVVGNIADRKRSLTAYVLTAMLESFKMMRERTPPFVALAVRCIEIDNLNDTYTLALTAYAMTMYKPHSSFTQRLLERLKEKAQYKENTMFWKRDSQPIILSGQGRAPSAEIEMTSYALLAMLTVDENAPIRDVIPIVRWLTNQRNAYGGFASTQDTVVALQALSVFATRIYGRGLDVSVNMMNLDQSLDFHVTQDNSLILQQQTLTSPESEVHVTAKGEGCFLMQMTSQYNVMNKDLPSSPFTLSVTTPVTMEMVNNKCRTRTVRICSSYTGEDDQSNMVVIEVRLTSGWIAEVNSLKQLLNNTEVGLKKYEMDNRSPDIVNFYFDQLDGVELCFDFNIVLEVDVDKRQPVMAKVFDYYESDLRATTLYEISPCSEEYVEEVDISLENSGDDLYIEETDIQSLNTFTEELDKSTMDKVSHTIDGQDNAPAPKVGPGCPRCVVTGTVDILHHLCHKQVWVVEPRDTEFDLQVVTAEGVSPKLTIDAPDMLHTCMDCQSLLLSEGHKSLVILEPTVVTDLGANIARMDTVVLSWSKSLESAIQSAMGSCGTAA